MAKWLIACEYSGRTREAFRARGHDVISCDLLPSEDNSPHHIIGDVFDVIRDYGPFHGMVAHPPCQFLANSGVRWLFKDVPCKSSWESTFDDDVCKVRDEVRWRNMLDAADFFAKLLAAPIPKVACENPVMHGAGRERITQTLGYELPTHFVQPWWFGDKAFKATGFTLKGLPLLVKPVTALTPPKPGTDEHKAWSFIHRASPGPNRWKDRSRTFPGVANAIAKQWS